MAHFRDRPIGEHHESIQFADGAPVQIGLPLLAISLVCTHDLAASATISGDPFGSNGHGGTGPLMQASSRQSVNGAGRSKPAELKPMSFRNYSGTYLGGIVEEVSGCGPLDGHHEVSSIVTVTQTDNASMMIITSQLDGGSCAYGGKYWQHGHLGFLQGYFSCDDGSAGTFSAFEIEKSASGIMGRFKSRGGTCSASGRIGGLSR